MARKQKEVAQLKLERKWFDFLWITVVVAALVFSVRAHLKKDFDANQMAKSLEKTGYLLQADVKR